MRIRSGTISATARFAATVMPGAIFSTRGVAPVIAVSAAPVIRFQTLPLATSTASIVGTTDGAGPIAVTSMTTISARIRVRSSTAAAGVTVRAADTYATVSDIAGSLDDGHVAGLAVQLEPRTRTRVDCPADRFEVVAHALRHERLRLGRLVRGGRRVERRGGGHCDRRVGGGRGGRRGGGPCCRPVRGGRGR